MNKPFLLWTIQTLLPSASGGERSEELLLQLLLFGFNSDLSLIRGHIPSLPPLLCWFLLDTTLSVSFVNHQDINSQSGLYDIAGGPFCHIVTLFFLRNDLLIFIFMVKEKKEIVGLMKILISLCASVILTQ